MKLFLKIIGYTFLGVIGLVAVALIAVQFISDDQYKKWIADAAKSATGRELAIDGELDVSLGTKVGLLAEDVRFANADWGTRDQMVTAERLFVQVPLFPLLKGVLDVTVEVDTPDILLETDAEGKGNWAFGDPSGETTEKPETGKDADDGKGSGLPIRPYIRNLEITNLSFAFNDQAGGANIDAGVEQLRIFVEGEQIPLILKAQYRGAPITLNGSLGNIDQWFNNEQTALSLKGMLNEARIAVEGTAGPVLPKPQAKVDMVLTADSISTFSDFAGTSLPDLQGLELSLTMAAEDGRLTTEDINLNLNDQRLQVALNGVVADLTELTGIDLVAEISSDYAPELMQELNLEIPYSLPQTVKLKTGVSGNLEKLSVEGLELIVKDEGLDVHLTGGLENVRGAGSGAADLSVNLASSLIIGNYIGKDLPEFGPFTASAKLSSGDKSIQLEFLHVDLQDPDIKAEIKGSAGSIVRSDNNDIEVTGIEIQADAGSQNLKEIAAKLGIDVPVELPASFDLSVSSAGSLEKLGITDLLATVRDPGVEVKLSGTVDNVMDQSGVSARLEAMVADTASLSKFTGIEIPALGSLNLVGKLLSEGETYRIDGLELKLDGETLKANLNAAVTDLLALTKVSENPDNYGLAGIDVSVDIEADSVGEIAQLAGVEIPELGTVNLQGHLGSSDKSITLDSLNVALSGELVKANVKAAVGDLIALTKVTQDRGNFGGAKIDASLDLNTASVSDLVELAGIEIPEIGALQVDGHIGSTDQSITLDTLKASLTNQNFKTNADVVIEDVFKLSGIKAVVDGDLKSLASLSGYVKKELPETGPLVVHLQADSDNPLESPVTVSAKLNGEGINAVIDATLPDVKAPQTFQTELVVDIESIVQIGALLGKKMPKDKAMKIVGRASGKPGEYRLDEFVVKAEESEILVDLAYLVPPAGGVERKNISGQVVINDFDFTHYIEAKYSDEEPTADEGMDAETEPEKAEMDEKEVVPGEGKDGQEEKKPQTGKKIFSDVPFAIGALHEYDIDFKLEAYNVKIPNGTDMNTTVGVSLDNGLLNIDPIDIDQTNGGSGTGHITLDARSEGATLDVELDFDRFVSPKYGGLVDLDVDLNGEGQSLATLMGSLDGHFAASIKDMELVKSFMSQFGAGLLSNLNPLDSEKTILECAVIRFDIEDGIADFHKKIAAQTSEVTWMGGGKINLKTEELDVGIAPKARGVISGLTNVGLASLVHVGGTLAEPKVGIDVADVAKKYVGYSAFVATGGLSFLAQKLVETTQANMDQCERILKDLEEK